MRGSSAMPGSAPDGGVGVVIARASGRPVAPDALAPAPSRLAPLAAALIARPPAPAGRGRLWLARARWLRAPCAPVLCGAGYGTASSARRLDYVRCSTRAPP